VSDELQPGDTYIAPDGRRYILLGPSEPGEVNPPWPDWAPKESTDVVRLREELDELRSENERLRERLRQLSPNVLRYRQEGVDR
jgi:hypothetical protein